MKIRTRITAVSIGVLVAVSIVLMALGQLMAGAAEDRYAQATLDGRQALWSQVVAREIDQMQAKTKALTRDRVIQKALRSGDAAAVKEQATTTQNTFAADHTLDRLQITDVQGRYLAAIPDGFTGTTRKDMVAAAAEETTQQRGVTVDDDGSLQAVLAFPLYARGKLKGVGVYSRNLQGIADAIHEMDGADVFLLTMDGRLSTTAADNQLSAREFAKLYRGTGEAPVQAVKVLQHDGRHLVRSVLPIHNPGGEQVAQLVSLQDQTETYAVQQTARYTGIAVVVVSLVGAAVGLFLYVRRSFRPLDRAVATLNDVAGGDLTGEVPEARGDDETARLASSLGAMVGELKGLVANINAAEGQLESALSELGDITQAGRQAMDEQSRETDQVATAVTQMTASIQEVARNAGEAAEAARQADGEAASGRETVADTVTAIGSLSTDMQSVGEAVTRLSTASADVSRMAGVIDGIAEQTNLLALNAAIEAARAGEQGRGFAVVADEVHTLATRTRESTVEIQSMLDELAGGTKAAVEAMERNQASAEETARRAEQARDALERITEAVTRINEMNLQIASAAEEQSTVAEAINTSVVSINDLSERAADSTRRTADASGRLAQMNGDLRQAVDRFRL